MLIYRDRHTSARFSSETRFFDNFSPARDAPILEEHWILELISYFIYVMIAFVYILEFTIYTHTIYICTRNCKIKIIIVVLLWIYYIIYIRVSAAPMTEHIIYRFEYDNNNTFRLKTQIRAATEYRY